MNINRSFKLISFVLVIFMLLMPVSGCKSSELTPDKAKETLDAYMSKVRVISMPLSMDLEGSILTNPGDELPVIDTYPFTVSGSGVINIELFGSTEKTGSNIDGWLNEAGESFNSQGFEINGQSVSVSIRPLSSGLGMDYILTGRYMPDAYSPANELWGEMLKSNNVQIELTEPRLVGNTAGILMKKQTYDKFVADRDAVTLVNVLDAAMNGEILLGYTNPYASGTGLNILTAMLQAFDSASPLSEDARKQLEMLQSKIPPVAYTTAQMRESAKNGILDAMVMEYQTYVNEPGLKDYVFTPFGARHDSPVYAIGSISSEKKAALKLFTDYCKSDEMQAKAERFGFNANDDYAGTAVNFTGSELFVAQQVWKEKKDSGRPVVAVFAADVSGSMEGSPINELKLSLINSSQYINEENYIGLISYSKDVYLNLPIAKFDAEQRAYFNGAVKGLSAGGNTATYDGVLAGIDMLLQAQNDIANAKLMLFVLSDGEQNEGYSLDKIESLVKALGVPIHTIGYNADLDELEKLSSINEASSINSSDSDVVYNLKNMFNAQM